jgi:hypothetical protein
VDGYEEKEEEEESYFCLFPTSPCTTRSTCLLRYTRHTCPGLSPYKYSWIVGC